MERLTGLSTLRAQLQGPPKLLLWLGGSSPSLSSKSLEAPGRCGRTGCRQAALAPSAPGAGALGHLPLPHSISYKAEVTAPTQGAAVRVL